MELAEHILLLLCFIGLVIQTVRTSYLSANKDFYKGRVEHLEMGNEFLRDRHDKDKSSVSSSNNREESLIKRINEQDQEIEKLHKEIKWFKTEYEAVIQKILKINSQNVELAIRNNKLQDTLELERCNIKQLESIIAATSLKKVKPLNTALDEMNYTADKQKKNYDSVLDSIDPIKNDRPTNREKDSLNYHYQVKNEKGITEILSYFELRNKVQKGEKLILTDTWDKTFSSDLTPDFDEDQYNTTAEDNEEDIPEIKRNYPFRSIKDCNCQKCKNGRRLYKEWRTKQKNGHRKDSNEA